MSSRPASTAAHPPGSSPTTTDLSPFRNLSFDVPAGLVTFLVALPLCLGVALASGAPLVAGLVAGVIGGMVVPLVSGAPLSVSGPAAGLAAIVAAGIGSVGGFPQFCLAVVLGGAIQLALGALRAGVIVSFIPASVIRGMLSAIGLLLILKQTPHAIGYDAENFASESFLVEGEGNTFSLLVHALSRLEWGAVFVSAVALAILLTFDRSAALKRLKWLPGALVVVVAGVLLDAIYHAFAPGFALESRHLVTVPAEGGPGAFFASLRLPDFAAIGDARIWKLAVTLAVVASLESLLSLDAIDRLDPFKRRSPPDRELLAQGLANVLSGLVGGLPITSVIVRSSANLNAGGRTRAAAFTHGALLLAAVLFAGSLLNRIPLAALATILVLTGWKLASPRLFVAMYRLGPSQFVPFVATVVAILLTDLLVGIGIGIVVGLGFTLRTSMKGAFSVTHEPAGTCHVRFEKDVYFFHKAGLFEVLHAVPAGTRLLVDRGAADFVEHDVCEALHDFQLVAGLRGVEVELAGIPRVTSVGGH
jgi:MFS superfamily sulfate permease-like transporter